MGGRGKPPSVPPGWLTEDDLREISELDKDEFAALQAEEIKPLAVILLLARMQKTMRLLYAPLEDLGVSPEEIDFTEYAIAMLHSLSLAMPPSKPSRTTLSSAEGDDDA